MDNLIGTENLPEHVVSGPVAPSSLNLSFASMQIPGEAAGEVSLPPASSKEALSAVSLIYSVVTTLEIEIGVTLVILRPNSVREGAPKSEMALCGIQLNYLHDRA